MTENEAIEMLKAKLTCMKLELLSCIEKGCDKDCESCEYSYTQGNMGEQKESLSLAIQALEEIQKYRAIGTVEDVEFYKKCYDEESYEFCGEYGTDTCGCQGRLQYLEKQLSEYQLIGTVEECRVAVERMKQTTFTVVHAVDFSSGTAKIGKCYVIDKEEEHREA